MASLVAAFVCGLAAAPALAAPHSGDVAPPFSLPGVTGGKVTLAAYKSQPVYLNFFASWCAPCNEEAASVAALYKKYHRRGLAIVGIDEDEDKSKALGFAHKYRWPFAIALDEGDLVRQYGVYGLPVHIFIDKQGRINAYRLGQLEPKEIEEAIRKIL